MPSLARRLWKWFAALVAGVLILLAVGVGLFRLIVPVVPEWRADAEAMAERALGWPVRIGAMDLRWAWLGPELVLTDVQVLARDTREPVAAAAQLDIAFGPADLFQGDTLRPSHIRVHRPTLALERDADGTLFLSGYALPTGGDSRVEWRRVLDATLRHGRFTVLDGELHYREPARGVNGWTLLLQKVSIASDGRRHELEGNVLPPGTLGEQLAFGFVAEGVPSQPENWRWSLDLGARELQLEWWHRQFARGDTARIIGRLNVAARLSGEGLRLETGEGRIAAEELGLVATEPEVTGPGARFQRIAFDWTLESRDESFMLDLREIEMRRGERRFTDGTFTVRHGDGDYPLEFAARYLPLDELHALTLFLPANGPPESALPRLRETLLRLAPRGEVRDLVFGLDTGADPLRFHIEAEFRDVGFAPWKKLPGANGLGGAIKGDAGGGRLWLKGRNVTIDTGDLFRTVLPAARLDGTFDWSREADGWRISSDAIRVENPEAQADAQLVLDVPFEGPVLIDMTATAVNVDFHARSTWLPVGTMSDALVNWLDNAIIDGHTPEARMTLRGPLENFPFRDGSGIFDIRFQAEDVVVEYAPGWPPVENLSAAVHFNGPALDIRIDHAELPDDLRVSNGHARFADVRDGELAVSADVLGDIEDAWRFLRSSPLAKTLGGLLDSLEVDGPMAAALNLDLPLDDADRLQLRVDTQLHGIVAELNAVPWPVRDLRGLVTVTDRDIRARRLDGRFHGNPFTLAIVPETGVAQSDAGRAFATTRLDMTGRSDVQEFHEYVPAAWLERLQGEFDWSGTVRVPVGAPITLGLSSTMIGVDSRLPAPLDRVQKADARLSLPGDGRIDAEVRVHDTGVAGLRFVEGPRGWDFDRGRLQLGATEAEPLPEETGLLVTGRAPLIDFGGWLDLEETASDAGDAGVPLLRAFDLTAGRFLLAGVALAEQGLQASRKAGGWELRLDGPAARGVVFAPSEGAGDDDMRPVVLDFERLHLPLPAGGEAPQRRTPDPRTLPALKLDLADFRVGPVGLGHVTGTLERTAIGYSTTDLRARAESFDVNVAGRWEYVADQHYTSITATLASSDLEDTLSGLGYQSAISAREAQANVTLAWRDAPLKPDLGGLEGTVSMDIRDGSLRDVQPGAGRFLGLLSIAALPRRLLLDFSDFLGEGLHFDSLRGDFVITEGNAYTTNVRLRGPSLSALLVGRTGLEARDYDQLAIVNPGVSASLPVAGYLAAGPQVGAALLLLSQLLKAPLADITQVKYRITGSWDGPIIERVTQDRNAPTPTDN